ncbi:hypothetical protein CEXT_646121 [Caerostris extrusa]|uniref:Uncharacterized protein n=1 Tax=Caerostris extrusa TaxID=172846 RepID=A0AAV4USN2_CAEEX|nr:hypothetical protein CEXT_646121 [Caerostris extrusa]
MLLASQTTIIIWAVLHFIWADASLLKISPFHFPGELDVGMRVSVQCAVLTGDPPFEFFLVQGWTEDFGRS